MQDTTTSDEPDFACDKRKEEDYVTGMHHVEREEGDLGKVIKPTPKGNSAEEGGHSDSEDSLSEDESKSSTPSTPSATKPPMTLQKKLIMAFKVALVVAMIVVMVHSRGEVFQKSAPPSFFFPQHSLVTDFYTGDLTALSERLLSADLSFVMYYAPWDYESQRIRLEMEKAARYHHEQIFFAAINCWHSTGSCRGRYKLRSFPALVLHVRSLSGQETKALAYGGLAEAEHMIKFLSRAMAPLVHISSTADLTKLQIDYSAIVVGYYDMRKSRYAKGFYSYYMAALRSLQYDRTHSTAWGIITNAKVAAAHSMHTTRTVHQYLWNATLVYSNSSVADSAAISNWVLNNFYETSSWLDLPGTKSLQLHTLLSEGPVLFLFAPNNPFWFSNDPYSLLRELSLDYLNCDELAHVKQLSKFLASARPGRRTLQRMTEKQCNTFLEEQLHTQHVAVERHQDAEDEMCCQSVHVWEGSVHRGLDRICDVCVHPADKLLQQDSVPCNSPNYEEGEISLMQHVRNIVSVFSDSCRDLVLQYSPWEHYSICCQSNSSSSPTKQSLNMEAAKPPPVVQQRPLAYPGPQEDDHIIKMTDLVAEDKCKRIYQASRGKLKPTFLKDVSSGQDITGLGCKTNHSLTFIAIDSIHHSDVALRLGVNLTESGGPGNTAAVIVDMQQQVHFIMNTALSRKTLVDFVLRYTRGQLDRAKVSNPIQALTCQKGQICIHDLTSETYSQVTHQAGEAFVVLHYTRDCASCSFVGHPLLSAAHHLRSVPNLTFARIDVGRNALPWNLDFPLLPAVIFHPAFRKEESRVFNSSLAFTAANLISFIVANLSPVQRLHLAVSSCDEDCKHHLMYMSAYATTKLHHQLTVATARFQNVMMQLSLLTTVNDPPNTFASEIKSRVEADTISKNKVRREMFLQLRDIITKEVHSIRGKLQHISRLQKLVESSDEEEMQNAISELICLFHHSDLGKADEVSAKSSSTTLPPPIPPPPPPLPEFHEEL